MTRGHKSDAQKRKQSDYGNRDWREMVTSQVAPGVIRIWGKAGNGFSPTQSNQ